ncbi:MAG: adenylate cyclase regulatory domain-containing protein [Thermoleophilaceae bacterium]
MAHDFEAEGLLDGVDDPGARRARLELLERLAADGVGVDELKRAVADHRLALLPVERMLASEGRRYSAHEIAARSGVGIEYLDSLWRSLGLPLVDRDERAYSDEDLEAARVVKSFLDAGFPPEGVLEVSRVLGNGMATLVAAVNDLARRILVQPGDSELDVAIRLAEAAGELAPGLDPLLTYVANHHRREQNRQAVVGATELGAAATHTVVCFADLVGFTQLGEELPPDELGGLARRLAEMAETVVKPPVTLVKTIGDAVMLVAPDADPMVDAALGLLERAEAEGEGFPGLRAGIAAGEALRRAGDWYGSPVNRASRVTARARRGSVLVTAEVREATRGDYDWSDAGRKRLRGVSDEVSVFRVRRQGQAADTPGRRRGSDP